MSSEALKVAATKAGLIDLDALALADLSADDGSVEAAAELISRLKADKPFLFPKKAADMTPEERSIALESIRRGPPPVPVETTKRASEMTELERRQYLLEHNRRFG
jgi:hypothetical protein